MTALYADLRDELATSLSKVEQLTASREFRDAMVRELRARGISLPELTAPSAGLQCNQILDAVLASAGALAVLAGQLVRHDGTTASRNLLVLGTATLPEPYLTLREKVDTVNKLAASARRENFGSYYRAIVGRDASQPMGVLWHLVSAVAQDFPGGARLDALIHVIALVSLDTADSELAAQYRALADEYARRVDAVHAPADDTTDRATSQRKLLRQVLATPAAAGRQGQDNTAYIVLKLDPSSARPRDAFLLSSWLYYGTELVARPYTSAKAFGMPALKREAIRLINDSLGLAEEHTPVVEPVIEFILPRDQMNMPVESWSTDELESVPLGTQFVVVVRDLDRQRMPLQRPVWREKWQPIADGSALAEEVISRWFSCAEQPLGRGELYRQMRKAGITGAGLTFPPEAPAHGFRIREMLNAGMPIAVWPHSCGHMTPGERQDEFARFRQRFCSLSRGRPIRELPGIVRTMRTGSDDFEDELSGMALLWDDPSRIVRPADFKFAAPGESP